MKRILLYLVLMIPILGMSQVLRNVDFYDYFDAILKIKQSDSLNNDNYSKYNLTNILLLDSTEIKLIEKLEPISVEEFRKIVHGIQIKSKTVGFVTNHTNIKELLLDKVSQKRIIECVNVHNSSVINYSKFAYPIYVKGTIAVFDIYGSTWSDTYYVKLENNILQINWLCGIVE